MALLVWEEMGVLEAQRQQLQAVLQPLEVSAVLAEMFLKMQILKEIILLATE